MLQTLAPPLTLTTDRLQQTEQAINAYIHSIDANPAHRSGAYPYYQFHPPGQPIRGTLLIFHGFSNKPHQMSLLANYLFQNGFNFYQPSIAGHVFKPPDRYWPQVNLKPKYKDLLLEKVPVLQSLLLNLLNTSDGSNRFSPAHYQSLVTWLQTLNTQVIEMAQAIERDDDDPDFNCYFLSSHLNYLTDAQARLAELDAMPGPIYTIGLSVGGAIALGLAAARPDRIRGVVAYAPLLKIYGKERREHVNLVGPLGIREMRWDPSLQFPLAADTATDRFGGFVRREQNINILQNIPTMLVLTENEDAADISTNLRFYGALGGEFKGHCFYLYPNQERVPHPMLDPREVSQGMSNRYWQSLYQETFRFLTTGQINTNNLGSLGQAYDLPQVPPIS